MVTTIKVPNDLRDRVNLEARRRGLTAAGLVAALLDETDRRQRMEAFGRAVRGADAEYWAEFHRWDNTLADGD